MLEKPTYHEPGIPAGEAWKEMEQLLDQEMPLVPLPQKSSRKIFGWPLWSIMVLVILFIAIRIINLPKEQAFSNNGKQGVGSVEEKASAVSSAPGNPGAGNANVSSSSSSIELNNESKKSNDSNKDLSHSDKSTSNDGKSATNSNGIANNLSKKPKTDHKKPSTSKKQSGSSRKQLASINVETDSKAAASEKWGISSPLSSEADVKDNKSNIDKKNTHQYEGDKDMHEKKAGRYAIKGQDLGEGITIEKSQRMMFDICTVVADPEPESRSLSMPVLTDSLRQVLEATVKLNGKKKTNWQANFHYGVRWQIPLPVQGSEYFFTGTNGKNQAYLVIVPQLWLGYDLHKNQRLSIYADPYARWNTGSTLLGSHTVSSGGPDSLSTIRQDTSLISTTGFSAGLQYQYRFAEHWNLGLGIYYQWQRKALLEYRTEMKGDSSLVEKHLQGMDRTNWNYLKPGFVFARFDAGYQFKNWQVGASLLLPVSNLSNIPERKIKPVNAQVFVSWTIH